MYKEFYEQTIGFDQYIEIRCFEKNGKITSKYFNNWNELKTFIKTYKNIYNLYCGINPRKDQGRKTENTNYIKNIIIDLEMNGTKDKLLDNNNNHTEYAKQLMRTINFIQEYLQTKYNLEINTVTTSGRGMHIYITLNEKIPIQEYKWKYKLWYKEIGKYINTKNPYAGKIKIDTCCSDAVRILGAPGSINTKYPEQPIRKIIYQNLNTNNKITHILDKYTIPNNTNIITKYNTNNNKHKYNEQTIFESPEFQVFKHNPIPGTNINNKLRLALKLLIARDKITNHEEIAQKITELGYPYKEMNFTENEYPDYKYNEKLLNSYVLENFEWATENKFKLPYELKEEKQIKKYTKYIKDEDKYCPDTIEEIKNPNDLIYEIKKFNNTFNTKTNGKIGLHLTQLEKYIPQHINNPKLKEFITQNNLIERLKRYI